MKTPKSIIQKNLSEICKIYHPAIPLKEIFKIVSDNGGMVIDESGQEWSGFLCGESGRVNFDISGIKSNGLNLSWYKMPSGRYEIVAYMM